MKSSSDHLEALARETAEQDTGFRLVVAFEYYDGPERGVAILGSGEAVRFESLGDSDSRFQRAFVLAAISGVWDNAITKLPGLQSRANTSRVVVPNGSVALDDLIDQLLACPSIADFAAVGDPNLHRLQVRKVSKEQLRRLRECDSQERFRATLRVVTDGPTD